MAEALRVLIIEDSEDDAELIVRELQHGGYNSDWERVQTAADMAATLNSRQWDIILSDYDMPTFSAPAALELLKASNIDIPFIVVSGKIGEEIAVEAMKAGANDYVMKDNLVRLCSAIERELRDAEVRKEQVRVENELHRSEENLSRAQAIAQIGSWEWDIVNNKYFWSDEMYRIHGISKDLAPSQEIARAVVHPDDRGEFDNRLAQGYAGNVSGPFQYRIISGDDQVLFVNNRVEVRYDESGNLSWMLGTIQDITELKQAQEEASRAKSLEELEVLRNTLWASVSHEIRTPLTSIKGIASTLLMPDVKWDEETQHDFLMNIDQESDRLVRIVNDVMDVSKIEAGVMRMDMEQTNLQEIIDNLLGRLDSLTTHHILETIIPDDLPPVFADELRIGQVITNLVENATSYSSEDTVITFRAEVASNNLVASVADHGCGIHADHIEKVFDRFYRLEEGVKRRKGGTGLGLAICKAIIDAHGGTVWVTSEIGVGSVFSFSLPVAGSIEANDQSKLEQRAEV